MGTILITYSDLSESAKRASDAANKLNRYADDIPSVAISPLSSLPGSDSSGYVSSAISLAQQKANSLRDRAGRYSSYSSKVNSFVSNAKTADSNVSRNMDNLANQIVGNQSLWDQVCYSLYKTYCSTIGSTELGAIFDNILSGAHDWADKWVTKAYNWFAHGDGKYVFNIAIAVLGTIGAIAAAVLSFPVSGVFAAIMAGLAIFAAVVSVVDTIGTVIDNASAISEDGTDPGLARYHGKTSGISDFVNKHSHNKALQTAAKWFDVSGKVAGIASWFGSGFVKTAADGTKVGTLDWQTIKGNFAGKLGVEFSESANKWQLKPINLFGFKGGSYTDAKGYGNAPAWVSGADLIKNATSGTKNVLSFISNGLTSVHDKSISLSTGLSMGSNFDQVALHLKGILDTVNLFKGVGGFKFDPSISWGHGVSVSSS